MKQKILTPRLLSLMAALLVPWSAHAQPDPKVPPGLPPIYNIPYQLMAPNGLCAQIPQLTTVVAVPCNAQDARQVFYVLQSGSDGDVGLPANPGAMYFPDARIVWAPLLQRVTGATYQQLFVDPGDPSQTLVAKNIPNPFFKPAGSLFGIAPAPVLAYTKVADQDKDFYILGRRLVLFGVGDTSTSAAKVIDGSSLKNKFQSFVVTCNVELFGWDPAPGKTKQCSMPAAGTPDPLSVRFLAQNKCLVPHATNPNEPVTFRLGPCDPSTQSQNWRLLPLQSYPTSL